MKPSRALRIAWLLLLLIPSALAQTLGTTNLLEGPTTGSDSVALALPSMNLPWFATTNASWLHLSVANQSGTGSTNVIFAFDANHSVTRTGTLTIAGQTLTVTQAGSSYVAANPVTTLVSLGFNFPNSVVLDGAGNVYVPSSYYGLLDEWMIASNTVTTLVSSGLSYPIGLALDGVGNLYIGDYGANAIKEWSVTSHTITTLVSSGLSFPEGIALDGAGNVYIADYGNNAIKEWSVTNHTVTSLVSGLRGPSGVAVDGAGNVYIADSGNNAIEEWSVISHTVTPLVSGLNVPTGVAVDGSGNVYIANQNAGAIMKWTAVSNTVTTLVSSGNSYYPHAVTVDEAGDIFFTGTSAIYEVPHAFVDPTAKSETPYAGSDTLPAVWPAQANLTGSFAPTTSSGWLTITGITNGTVSFAFTANTSGSVRTANITLLGQTIPVTQMAPSYLLGTTNLLEGPTAGSDNVVLSVSPVNFPWVAATNDSWLHLSVSNQSGAGSTNVFFTFDANLGATRTSTLNIAGQTLTVTQAGSTYAAAAPVTVLVSSGLNNPDGVAVDNAGNVYIGDTLNNAVQLWNVATDNLTPLVNAGIYWPYGVAVDSAGNVYITSSNGVIHKWNKADGTLSSLVASGLNYPQGVAVDHAGNVYIADTDDNVIKVWSAASSNVTTVVSSGLSGPGGVAVDAAGNVYIADTGHNAIKMWNVANSNVTTLATSGLSYPRGVAVDGSGNVFFADYGDNTVWRLNAAGGNPAAIATGGVGVAVDSADDVYIVNENDNIMKEVVRAFVDPTAKLETAAAGSDALPMVLPATANLTGPFTPVSDSDWLTITGSANGVVGFAFATNSSSTSRTANINLLGQNIRVIQTGSAYSLGTTNLLEGPTGGSDSVVLALTPLVFPWTATANASWLHLSVANQSGVTGANVIFTFDANQNATRIGTLTIGNQTLTVTQAGSSYVAANPMTTLVSSGLFDPEGVAVDRAGNVYVADSGNQAIKEWTVASNTVTTLVSSGLVYPSGVAIDGVGNVYIADTFHSAIKEWVAASNTVATLVNSGLSLPFGVAVDGAGDVYIADTYNSAIKEWSTTSNIVTTLVASGLNYPFGVAVDGANNVYIADTLNNVIEEWTAANNTATTMGATGLSQPRNVAVDGSGNVYIADQANNAIKEWTAASNTITTLAASGLNYPWGVAVDGSGNVYIADYGNNAIKELLHAFVDPTAKVETAATGSDVLAVVLPVTVNLTGSFAPVSDSAWLTITGSVNGVVGFTFTANALATNRTAHITLLGQTIAVTQNAAQVIPPTLTGLTILDNGAFQFGFTNNQGASFTVLTTTNLLLPLTNWTLLGTITNNGSGQYQFTDLTATNECQRFYRVSSP